MSTEIAPSNVQWIYWFCHLPGNDFFVPIDKSYIEDSFNIFGLRPLIPGDFCTTLSLILDQTDMSRSARKELTENAKLLYGLIHARFICSTRGLDLMRKKYVDGHFGVCPRMFCREQKVVPIGMSEVHQVESVKLYCPSCQDVFACLPRHSHIDSAYFGPTFAPMFYMTFDTLVPQLSTERFVPRVYGFKVHFSSSALASAAKKTKKAEESIGAESSSQQASESVTRPNRVANGRDDCPSVDTTLFESRRKETVGMATLTAPMDRSAPSASIGTNGEQGSGGSKRKYIALAHDGAAEK